MIQPVVRLAGALGSGSAGGGALLDAVAAAVAGGAVAAEGTGRTAMEYRMNKTAVAATATTSRVMRVLVGFITTRLSRHQERGPMTDL
jgi:hypothetical protein